MNPGHDPVVQFVPQFHLLWVNRPGGLFISPSILSLRLFLKTGWSATCRALLLGCFGHYCRLHSRLLIFANPGWVGFKRWVSRIQLGNGFLDTHSGPVNPDLYFATPAFILRTAFLGFSLISRPRLALPLLASGTRGSELAVWLD